jgi:hypothetical protein
MKISPKLAFFLTYMLFVPMLCELNPNTFTEVPKTNEKKKEMIRKIIVKINRIEDLYNKIDEIRRKVLALGEYQKVELKYGNSTEIHTKSQFDTIMQHPDTYVKSVVENSKPSAGNVVYKYTNATMPMNSTQVNRNASKPMNSAQVNRNATSYAPTKAVVNSTKPVNNTVLKDPRNALSTQGASLGSSQNKQTAVNANQKLSNNSTQLQKPKKPVNNKIPVKFTPVKIRPNPFAQITHIQVINYYLQRIDNLNQNKPVLYPVIQVLKKQSEISLILTDSVRV